MGLLDSLVGAAVSGALGGNNNQQQQGGGALGGINPALLSALVPVVMGMLGNNSQQGGIGGLVSKFTQAGLGNAVNSWIGTGQNAPISGDQLSSVLGSDVIGQIAQKAGLGQGEVAGGLAQILPEIINGLTPNGQAPATGFGNSEDLMGALGGLLGGGQQQQGGLGSVLGGLAGMLGKR